MDKDYWKDKLKLAKEALQETFPEQIDAKTVVLLCLADTLDDIATCVQQQTYGDPS